MKLPLLLIFLICVVTNISSQNITIPDAVFKNYLVSNPLINTTEDTEISIAEANAFTGTIDVEALGIASLTGIEAFTNITELYCQTNTLTTLDVTNNTKLNVLYCQNNSLTTLDVTNNTSLTFLYCAFNQLTNLDVTNNIVLKSLYVFVNKLTSLDVSKNLDLDFLICFSNNLTNLDVTNNVDLTFLDASVNQLTSIDLTENLSLGTLKVYNNSFTAIDIAVNTSLTELQLQRNQLTSLDVTNNTLLTNLQLDSNQIGTLDLSNNTELYRLYSSSNQLTSLDVTSATDLTFFTCGNNQIETLNLSSNTKLSNLYCGNNLLEVLDFTNNTELRFLGCENNQLTTLDFSTNLRLFSLACDNNFIENIDVANCILLETLSCDDNKLTDLNITKNIVLDDFSASNNLLTDLYLANGNNESFNLSNFDITGNLDLVCVQVDDTTYSNANWGDKKDASANYSTNCYPEFTFTAENGTITTDITPTSGTAYTYGDEVVLTATPDENYQFDDWSGDISGTTNPFTIFMDTDKSITASFSLIQRTLNLTNTNGSISVDIEPTNGTYDINTEINLTATPNEGYEFVGWGGDVTGGSNQLTVTMNVDKNITANFNKITLQWLGLVDNDWSNPSNWEENTVPSFNSKVEIGSGLTNYPTVDAEITINSITLENNASLIANANINAVIIYRKSLSEDWNLISSPVINETFDNLLNNNAFATGTGSNIGISSYNNTISNPWVYKTDTATGIIEPGLGLSVKLATADDIEFTGNNINANDVNYPISVGVISSFNLIGNPFTSYINSGDFTTTNNALLNEQTVWLWNGTTYETHTLANPIEIEPVQGFFVEALSNNAVTFEVENQSHKIADTVMKQQDYPVVELTVNDESTKIYFIENTSKAFDNGYDGSLFGGKDYDFTVYTQLVEDDGSEKKLAIQTLAMDNIEATVVPVGLIAKAGQELTFSAKTVNIEEGIDVYLEDIINNIFTNLKDQTYKTTLENDTNGIGQFYIHTTAKNLSIPDNNNVLQNITMYKSSKNKITITGLESSASIVVYSLMGKKVMESNTTSLGTTILNLPILSTGVYTVKLNTETSVKTQKIILE